MFTIYKNIENELRILPEAVPGCWIHVMDPDSAESERVRKEFGVPQAFLHASLDTNELARMDKETGIMLVVVLVPYRGSDESLYRTVPLGIILRESFIITVCRNRIEFVDHFVLQHKSTISTAKHNRLLLQLLLFTAYQYLFYLRQLETMVEKIQLELQYSLDNKVLLKLLQYQKSLTYFRTSLELNRVVMKRLQRSKLFEMYSEDRDLLDDVLTETEQAAQMTKISSDILNQTMDAFATIISNNLNDVMKILASATIILSIPSMIASIYGMNVILPGQNSGLAFAFIIFVSVAISVVLALVFRRRNWL